MSSNAVASLSLINSICFIGSSYVCGPTIAVIADSCSDVSVADLSAERFAVLD